MEVDGGLSMILLRVAFSLVTGNGLPTISPPSELKVSFMNTYEFRLVAAGIGIVKDWISRGVL